MLCARFVACHASERSTSDSAIELEPRRLSSDEAAAGRMGKKRKATDLMSTKSFVGKHGEVKPRFKEPKTAGGMGRVTGLSQGNAFLSDDESEEDDAGKEEEEEEEPLHPDFEDDESEEDEEEARELALEIAALNSSRAERGEETMNISDALAMQAENGNDAKGWVGNKAPDKVFKNDKPGMKEALERMYMKGPTGKRPGFVEILATTGASCCYPFQSLHLRTSKCSGAAPSSR